MNARARSAAIAVGAMMAALLPALAATAPAGAVQPVPGHTGSCRRCRGPTCRRSPPVRSGTSRRSATPSTSWGRSPGRDQGQRARPCPAWPRGTSTPAPAPELQADHHRRRRRGRRGLAGRHQALHRRHVQDRQRRGRAQGRRPEPDHRRADDHLALHRQHEQPRPPRSRRPTPRSTSAAGSPRSTARTTTGLAAVNSSTGAVDTDVQPERLSGGIGANGALTVQQLKLTHDEKKLIVIHTGRQITGQDRLGIGIIDTTTKTLLPWRTRLWDDNLAKRRRRHAHLRRRHLPGRLVHGREPAAPAATRPPISDTAIRFPIAGADNVQPTWISRHFDSVYSVAITEDAVYLGGHFQFEPSPTRAVPVARPRQRRLRHRPGPVRLRPGRRRSSAATTSAPSTRRPGTRSSGTRDRTPSRATRPCWPPRAACSPVATRASRAAKRRPYRVLRLQQRPERAHRDRHHHHRPDRGPRGGRPARRSPSPARPRRPSGVRPGPGGDPGPQQQALAAGQRRPGAPARQPPRDPDDPERPRRPTWSLPLTLDRHDRDSACIAKTFGDTRQRRVQGEQEDRVVRHDRPTPSTRDHRAERQHHPHAHLHPDRHRDRRPGVNRLTLLVPRREQPVPAAGRHASARSSTRSRSPGRGRCDERHLAYDVTLPHEGDLAGERHGHRHRGPGRPAQRRPCVDWLVSSAASRRQSRSRRRSR